MHFSIDRTVHTTAFDKPVVDHWSERKIAQTAAGSTEKDQSDDRPLQRWTRYRLSYIPLPQSSCQVEKIYWLIKIIPMRGPGGSLMMSMGRLRGSSFLLCFSATWSSKATCWESSSVVITTTSQNGCGPLSLSTPTATKQHS